jgi:hypothetical protein
MATLYISEHASLAQDTTAGNAQIVKQPALTTQTVVIQSGTPLQSAAFGAATRIVRVAVDVVACVLVGPVNNTHATTSSPRMAANQTEYFAVNPGDQLSVIAALV